jgi:hypothetical protein
MKTLLITTATALTLTTAAFAQDDSDQLRMSVAEQLDTLDMNVDVEALSDDQIAEIYAISQGDEESGERAKIRSVLEGGGYQSMELGNEMIFVQSAAATAEEAMPEGANELRDQVAIKLGEHGFDDVNAENLTDDQVAKLYAVVQSSDSEGARQKIESILE